MTPYFRLLLIETDLKFGDYGEETVAEHGNGAGDGADDHGAERVDHHVGRRADGHAAGQRRVLDVHLRYTHTHMKPLLSHGPCSWILLGKKRKRAVKRGSVLVLYGAARWRWSTKKKQPAA